MKLRSILAIAIFLACGSVSHASLINAYCYNDGDGAITMNYWGMDINDPENTVWMDETLHGYPAHALVDFYVDSPEDPIATITKEVENDTLFDWTGYQIKVIRPSAQGTFSILTATPPAGWTQNITPVSLIGSDYVGIVDYYGGTAVAIGDVGTFKVKISFLNNANFTLEQIPIPEPGMLALLGTGLVGLLAYARRRHRS